MMIMYGPGDDGQPPTPEQIRAMQQRHNPPDNEVPGIVAFQAVLGRTPDLVIALVSIAVYSSGLSFELPIRLRRDDETGRIGDELYGGRRHGTAATALLFGVGYPDGRKATNVGHGRFPRPDSPADQPSLSPNHGGGGGHSYSQSYWLNPLPGPGDLTVVCAWPSRGIAESRTVIPAALTAAGLAAVIELWPWEARVEAAPPPEPPELDLPSGSWFAQ